jgi:hypothetical protein
MTDEIERLLGAAEYMITRAHDSHTRAALRQLSDAVRLLAARPAPAGGAGEDEREKAWEAWLQYQRGSIDPSLIGPGRYFWRAGWDAARAADAARGERGG